MIAMLVRRLVLVAFLAFLWLALIEQFNPTPPPMAIDFHHADYSTCVTVRPPPLQPHSHGTILYRRRSDMA